MTTPPPVPHAHRHHHAQHAFAAAPDPEYYSGPLQWRHLIEWMRQDGVITNEEAERTVARISDRYL